MMIDDAIKIASDLTDKVGDGGPRSIIFILLLNFALILFIVRTVSKLIMTHYQKEIESRDSQIKRLHEVVAEKDRIIDERFDLFKDLTHNYVGIAKDVSNSVKMFEIGFTELRTRMDMRGRG